MNAVRLAAPRQPGQGMTSEDRSIPLTVPEAVHALHSRSPRNCLALAEIAELLAPKPLPEIAL